MFHYTNDSFGFCVKGPGNPDTPEMSSACRCISIEKVSGDIFYVTVLNLKVLISFLPKV